MGEPEVRAKLRDWIAKHAKRPLGAEFDDRTPVLELGILSSLDIVEFVLYIESLRGDELDPDRIQPEAFNNVDTLYSAFFAAG
jgi:clorobiocin biosynthesis protein CloN5